MLFHTPLPCHFLIFETAGLISAYSEKDPERQEELYVKFVNQQIVPHVRIVDKQLADNGTGFLVGSEV